MSRGEVWEAWDAVVVVLGCHVEMSSMIIWDGCFCMEEYGEVKVRREKVLEEMFKPPVLEHAMPLICKYLLAWR